MSVLLETPVLWLIFGAALGLCLFDRAYRGPGGFSRSFRPCWPSSAAPTPCFWEPGRRILP